MISGATVVVIWLAGVVWGFLWGYLWARQKIGD